MIGKEFMELHKSGSSLGRISRCFKELHSSVQTIIRKYRHDGNVQLSYCSGRRQVFCLRDEYIFWSNMCKFTQSKSQRSLKMLDEVAKILTSSTVKRLSVRRKPLLQKKQDKDLHPKV
uniref:Uncharacterized protein n=1 Tax=Poecilia mexicana TaxID=48701 RepID=A0A3B3YEG0_9TELE